VETLGAIEWNWISAFMCESYNNEVPNTSEPRLLVVGWFTDQRTDWLTQTLTYLFTICLFQLQWIIRWPSPQPLTSFEGHCWGPTRRRTA